MDALFETKANDELVCLILHAQHLINAKTLYRQDITSQFEEIFEQQDQQILCPVTNTVVELAEFDNWLAKLQTAESRAEMGDVAFVAVVTINQLWVLGK
ncbi:hypothetical protein [Ferrimonas senticii]|uniref:hypothetical protein n=1 Tax=Ferrimonas senticii TaxID=394566 RepID=UPI00041F8A09|nr:hypothetical protein [Ferrimonas senticii]